VLVRMLPLRTLRQAKNSLAGERTTPPVSPESPS